VGNDTEKDVELVASTVATLEPVVKDVKAGYRTTEFWVMVLAAVGNVSAAWAGVLPDKWAAAFATGSAVAYKLSRGLAKV
jgi:hypothetical protein